MTFDDTLEDPTRDGPKGPRDASDVIEGEIGEARLIEPTDDDDGTGADLSKLPDIDPGPPEGTVRDREQARLEHLIGRRTMPE